MTESLALGLVLVVLAVLGSLAQRLLDRLPDTAVPATANFWRGLARTTAERTAAA
jgi:hypothetical protein